MSCRTHPRSQTAIHLRHPAAFCRSAPWGPAGRGPQDS